MIDFRYHLVSLISVFLALAVGIALGAGPLKETIGDQLTGQVDQLRSEKDDLREQLDQANASLEQREAYLDAASTPLIAGILDQWRVAVVRVGDVDGATRDAVAERLEESGAQVVADAQVLDGWTDDTQTSYRSALAGQVLGLLNRTPPDDATPDAQLAEALAESLTWAEPGDSDQLASSAASLVQILTTGKLVSLDSLPTVPADAVVLVYGGPGDSDEPEGTTPPLPTAYVDLASALQSRSHGLVVSEEGGVEPSLIDAIASDDSLVEELSTVGAAATLPGQISIPLALAERVAGTVGHYGARGSDTAVMPARVVPPLPPRLATGTSGEAQAGTTPGGTSDSGSEAGS